MASTRARTSPFWLVLSDRVAPLSEGRHVIGRGADAELCLTDDLELSRHHACLEVTSTAVYVEDLGSRNGTWLDERRVNERTSVAPGSVIRVGSSRLELHAVGVVEGPHQKITAAEVPKARAARAAEMTALPTQRTVDMDRGLLEAERAIDEGRTSEARRLLYEYMVLLDAAVERVPPTLLDQAAVVSLKLAVRSGDPRHSQWIAAAFERAHRPISEQLREQALRAGMPLGPRGDDAGSPEPHAPRHG